LKKKRRDTMTDYTQLSNPELVLKTKNLVAEERRLNIEILHLLREVEKRRLFLEMGYGSLFDFTVRELGFDEASASRRIQAMYLVKSVPEVEEKLKSGSLSLTVAAKTQRFLRAEEKLSHTYSTEQKKELIGTLENKSVREVERALVKLSPEAIPQERQRVITEDKTEYRLVVSKELQEKLERLKSLMSHKLANPTMAQLLSEIADLALERLDPLIFTLGCAGAGGVCHEIYDHKRR
jgi:hypothetical protein